MVGVVPMHLDKFKILRTKSLFSPAKMTFERMAYTWKIK